jgi:hypothetical protein
VLVVVEHRDVQLLLEPRLDVEAPRRRDILEVDAAEGGAMHFTPATIRSGSLVPGQIGEASTPASSLP